MSSVDVFVPCYNYGRFLRDAVNSVLSQHGVDVRVLILDDCSQDDSEQIGRELAAEDSRIEYRRHTANVGHIATYNEGIDWLAGDYCLMLSADDVLTPGALARAAAVMGAHPEVGLTHGAVVCTMHPEHDADVVIVTPQVTIQTGAGFIQTRCEIAQGHVETPTAIARTSIQKLIGYYRPELPHSGDLEMWLRFAAHGSVAYIHAHQAFYRMHGENMSLKYQWVRDLIEVDAAFQWFFKHNEERIANTDRLRDMTNHAIAELAFEGAYHAFLAGDSALVSDYTWLAQRLDPQSRLTRRWLQLRCKRLVGSRLWNGLRSCRRWLRSTTSRPALAIGLRTAECNVRVC